MNTSAGLKRGAALIVVAILIVLGLYKGGLSTQGPSVTEGSAPDPVELASDAPSSDTLASDVPASDGLTSDGSTSDALASDGSASNDSASDAMAEDPQAPTPEPGNALLDAPSVDSFRLDKDGRMLVSGRGQPGALLSILLDGEVLTTLTPGGDGQFAEFLDLTPGDAPRVLSLSMVPADGGEAVVSTDQIIIAPDAVATAASETEPSQDVASTTDTPTVLLADETGVSVLQAPSSANQSSDAQSSVTLDTITYPSDGQVQLSGRATPGNIVRVYLDDKLISSPRIDDTGGWRSEPLTIGTGDYTLRVDEISSDGQVISRMETPFIHEGKQVLAEAEALNTAQKVNVVTVQPGESLWAISREIYGDGVLYVRVFNANADLIRDPDLIYPGQVFTIPD